MSGMFPEAAARLAAQPWGTKIKDADGNERDTNVQPAIEEVLAVLLSGNAMNLSSPLVINYSGRGAAIQVLHNGTEPAAIELRSRLNGRIEEMLLGLGQYSSGIVASDVQFAPTPLPSGGGGRDPMLSALYDVVVNVIGGLFGVGCCPGGEGGAGSNCLEQLSMSGHAAIPGYDRSKKQFLGHNADADCLSWIDAAVDLCEVLPDVSGYDALKTQVLGHTTGTCKLIDTAACE